MVETEEAIRGRAAEIEGKLPHTLQAVAGLLRWMVQLALEQRELRRQVEELKNRQPV